MELTKTLVTPKMYNTIKNLPELNLKHYKINYDNDDGDDDNSNMDITDENVAMLLILIKKEKFKIK